MSVQKDLLEKAKEFQKEASRCISRGSLDSAVVLVSKAAFSVVDSYLFENFGIVPSNHQKRKDAVRFRVTKALPYLNDVYDKYIAAYQQRMTKSEVEVVLDALRKICEITKIEVE